MPGCFRSVQQIENPVKCDAQTHGLTNTPRAASILIDAVMDKIRLNEQLFHRFVQLLEEYQCCYVIVKEIKASYEQLKQSQQDTSCNQRKNDSMPAQFQAKTLVEKSKNLLSFLCFC